LHKLLLDILMLVDSAQVKFGSFKVWK